MQKKILHIFLLKVFSFYLFVPFKDKSHHSSLPIKGFEMAYTNPKRFRDMLKNTFYLKLNPKELGDSIFDYFH